MTESVRTMPPKCADANNNPLLDELVEDEVEVEMEFEVMSPTTANIKERLQSLSPDEWIRGSTPDGIEQRCLELCQAYIGGRWCAVRGTDEVTVKRVSGGFTNQLYHVRLNHIPDHCTSHTTEPLEVAIKLYQEKHMKNYHHEDYERLNDIVILPIAAQTGIGPQVYGIFNDGFIQQFIKHQQFGREHQSNPGLVRECAHLLARIHTLKVPIRKDGTWLFRVIREWIEYAYEHCHVRTLVAQLQLETLQRKDLLEELLDLERLIVEANSPVVFSHNDFRGSNILVSEHTGRLLTVDMEHCAYAPRAFDIATILSEWGKERFDFDDQRMPPEHVIAHFVRLYIEGCDQLDATYSKRSQNSFATIMRETKLFLLLNVMFFIALSIKQEEVIIEALPFNPLIKMTFVHNHYKVYHQTKQRLIDDGTIQL